MATKATQRTIFFIFISVLLILASLRNWADEYCNSVALVICKVLHYLWHERALHNIFTVWQVIGVPKHPSM